MHETKKDFEFLLSDDVFIIQKYVNQTLTKIASDTNDDGTISYVMNEHGYRSNSFTDFNF